MRKFFYQFVQTLDLLSLTQNGKYISANTSLKQMKKTIIRKHDCMFL